MAPWMIVALVIGAGFVVLLIAPTIHRKVNAKSRDEAEAKRLGRAESLRSSSSGLVKGFAKATDAAMLRDRLILVGVRSELIQEHGQTLVVYSTADSDAVDALVTELGIG